MDGPRAAILAPTVEEEAQTQLEQSMLISQHEVIMPYPNLLMDPNNDSGAMKLREQQVAKLEEYARKCQKDRRKHTKDMCAASDGIFGTHEFDKEIDFLGDNSRAPKGYSEIVAKGRRQREEAIRQRQDQEIDALVLGGTDTIQGSGSDREDHFPLSMRKRARLEDN